MSEGHEQQWWQDCGLLVLVGPEPGFGNAVGHRQQRSLVPGVGPQQAHSQDSMGHGGKLLAWTGGKACHGLEARPQCGLEVRPQCGLEVRPWCGLEVRPCLVW
eukprot:g25802.t1